ncbi:MAG: hypothetical protein GY853_14120 [PVC group bacterium]|nr:hypothetical protein [PVC group bacterium]
MIQQKPKTAKGYYYYHRLMWSRLVKEMEKGKVLDTGLKYSVWNSLFDFDGEECNHCFACMWKDDDVTVREYVYYIAEDGDCEDECLLHYTPEDGKCLGGLYEAATGVSQYRIEAAKEIRDLPMKDKWK